jgi:hypothetical protein
VRVFLPYLCELELIWRILGDRLNIFGFLTHPDLAEADPEGLCGNYGTCILCYLS